jgi:hypothetical protein
MQPFGCLSSHVCGAVPSAGTQAGGGTFDVTMANSPPRRKQPTSRPQSGDDEGVRKGITQEEVKVVEEMSTPRTPVIYEVVRRLGDEEMQRPAVSLWWSGLAAGLSISFSLLAQAILESGLPDAQWRPLLTGFGYSVGFLMTVMAR